MRRSRRSPSSSRRTAPRWCSPRAAARPSGWPATSTTASPGTASRPITARSPGARLEAETRLKAGELRALVATSSLELGIDVGAIDLVVQLQSPRNIAAALQRVGRAGHALSRVSKGRIVVTKGEELVEAAAVVQSIGARLLDRVAVPQAPLDVLAQQIVASVAAESLEADALYARLRAAAPYRTLARETFLEVVRAVAEPLPAEVKGAPPRILWDRVNDRLHARRGTRFLALTSGGTIIDAGLYDVYVADTDLKVGTLDEEFVTESLPGDVFLLGSSAWRIAKVRADRVLVEDARGMSPTIPFWKGEHPSRSWDLGVAVRRLRHEAAARLDEPGFEAWAAAEGGLDPRAARALRAWLVKAGEVLAGVPDDAGIVVESFSDEMGGRHTMIHSVFGMRVNGAWGMALREKVRRMFGLQAEAGHVDDGILLSFAPGQVPPVPERLPLLVPPGGGRRVPRPRPHRLAALHEPLPPRRRAVALHPAADAGPADPGLCSAAPRRRAHGGGRRPAHLPRRRRDAARVLRGCPRRAAAQGPARPSARRCHVGAPRRHAAPSPFVYPLLLAWDWAYLDAGHAEERRTDTVSMRKAWSVVPGPLQPEIVAAVEAELQKTAPERRARDANELAAILDEVGDLARDEIADRVVADPDGLVAALAAERRIVPVEFASGRRAWSAATDAAFWAGLATDAGLDRVALRLTRTRGPVTARWLADRYGLPPAEAAASLDRLLARGHPAAGRIPAGDGRAAVRAHRGARRDPAASGARASASAARRHGGGVHGVRAPPAPSAPGRQTGGAARCARRLRAAAGRGLPPARLGAGSARRARRALRPGVARSPRPRRRDRVDRVRAARRAGAVRTGECGASGERGVAAGSEREAGGAGRPRQERAAAPAAAGRLLRAGPGPRGGPEHRRCARRPLGVVLGRARHTGHVQRDRRDRRPRRNRRRRPATPARPGARRPAAPAGAGAMERPRRGRSALPEDREEAHAHLLLGRYGVLARELAPGEWASLRHAPAHGVRRRGGARLLRRGGCRASSTPSRRRCATSAPPRPGAPSATSW
jgi:DEAD/H associated/Helicase conserved C-terminal domain